ncbi:MAG: HEAT repeat domain-containing protein [Sediminicola sp.]
MKTVSYLPQFLFFLTLCILFDSCQKKPELPKEIPMTIREDSLTVLERAVETEEKTSIQLYEGLQLSLWATDSLAPDPVAMSIDDYGRVYLTRTNRQKNSEFDIRGFREWMTPSISLQSVEDRRAFLHETFAAELSSENEWLEDLNNDSIHDWRDLAVEKEEIWMLEDENGDGMADVSKRILTDFNDEVTDVAGALLVRKNDVFVGVGPDMWRVTDTNEDGVLDTKTSIAHGFAVHIGFSGHGMSGAIEGPDGKIYWGIGDIGANITTVEGVQHKYPNQGVIVRSNPDGSDFEVFAAGLRNTHEFVFDEYGNIISSDNDGDHRGESERLVHIVEGSDAGWRANWQYGKYTDPKNNGYKVWMDEKFYLPRWEGQAAHIIPPIMNFHNGPTGMAYNPGTALGKDWLNKFFLVEFVGDPSLSHIWSFGLEPEGASFVLGEEKDILSGVLPTGIRFAPDGALYLADWINGWDTKNYGRVWKLDVTEEKNDMEEQRRETERLMTVDYEELSNSELTDLLRYPDMRIRQKAQFQLASEGFWAYRALKNVLEEEVDQLARIHAIWGIGQMAAKDLDRAEPLVALLNDQDPEIIAQALKTLGDVRYSEAAGNYVPLLQHPNARVQFFAAQALGRIQHKEAVQPLLDLISSNADKDLYIRHAAVLALSRIGETAPIIDLVDSPDRSLRIAAVLVLRRLQHPEVAKFLNDADEYVVTEAARAINDDWSIESGLPALAATLQENRFSSEPLLRRAINAALRVGGEKELDLLIDFAKRNGAPAALRGEALAALGTWSSPSVLDRVDGRYRGEVTRDPSMLREKMEKDIPAFLNDANPAILIGTTQIIGSLGMSDQAMALRKIMDQHPSARVRATILQSLAQLNYPEMEAVIKKSMGDSDRDVRAVAVGLIDKLDISKETLPDLIDPIFKNGSTEEQQEVLSVLGEMPVSKSGDVLEELIKKARRNRLPPSVTLDLIEAVEASKDSSLMAQIEKVAARDGKEAYKETLYGGRWYQGMTVFNNNPTAQCVRCHSVGGAGGKVGPALDNIGKVLSREEILESLIHPNARLAPGYGSVALTLKNGQVVRGLLEAEGKNELRLRTTDAEPMMIATSRIEKRENMPSGMPPMGMMITKRELRDLIEYLSSLKEEVPLPATGH